MPTVMALRAISIRYAWIDPPRRRCIHGAFRGRLEYDYSMGRRTLGLDIAFPGQDESNWFTPAASRRADSPNRSAAATRFLPCFPHLVTLRKNSALRISSSLAAIWSSVAFPPLPRIQTVAACET